MTKSSWCWVALWLGSSAMGCAPDELEHVGVEDARIINGELDTTHQAVVAVFSDMAECTGTILYAAGGAAYVLTAAHCFGSGPIKYVIRGNDYDKPDQVLQVVKYLVHPLYNAKDQSYDFAMLKAQLAADNIPQILPMAPVEDKMKVGSAIEHVGYGLTSYPSGQTTLRHHVMGKIDQLAQLQLAYNQPSSGPCSGDSGGPELVETPFGTRVAGVVSYGDQECKSTGVSGRVSGVYQAFILPFVGGLPNDGGSGSSSSTGAASSSSAAAGSTSATTAGAGGASGETAAVATAAVATGVGGGNDGWTAGSLRPTAHTGELVTTSCAAANGGAHSGVAAWLCGLVVAGALVFARRRT